MYKIAYSTKVKHDLLIIKEFIAQDSPIYAIKTIQSILKTVDILGMFPYLWKEIWDDLRELVEKKYKYKIAYTIKKNTIRILSVYKYQETWQ